MKTPVRVERSDACRWPMIVDAAGEVVPLGQVVVALNRLPAAEDLANAVDLFAVNMAKHNRPDPKLFAAMCDAADAYRKEAP